MKLKTTLFLAATLLITLPSFSQDGSLDLSFGIGGKVITPIGIGQDYVGGMVLQPDGKIIMVGNTDANSDFGYALVRYNPDGTLDPGFGTLGKVIPDISNNDSLGAVALQPDGKIVVAGSTRVGSYPSFITMRYLNDGTLDYSFGNNGQVVQGFGESAYANSLIIQQNGKIIVGGSYFINYQYGGAMVRYNTDGTLDSTFGSQGSTTVSMGPEINGGNATSLVLQGGKIVMGGRSLLSSNTDFALTRLSENGTQDATTFGTTTDFSGTNDSVFDLAVQPNGRIIAVGTAGGTGFAVARYGISGVLDNSFGSGGKIVTTFENGGNDWASAVAIQNDNKILVAGRSADNFAVARYNINGSLDPTFGTDGKVITPVDVYSRPGAMLIQPDGKILVGGSSYNGTNWDFCITRYNATPLANSAFEATIATHIFPNPVSANGTLFCNTSFEDITLDIFNTIGQKIKHIDHFSGDRIALNPIDFKDGFYYIRMTGENKLLFTSKFFVKN
ncbi:MAG: T9SS type A sorting domain-containing protein [Flavobacterium sp.]|nr:T9SS type A sorting domain-containing protein [Flavobacterium sp.]